MREKKRHRVLGAEVLIAYHSLALTTRLVTMIPMGALLLLWLCFVHITGLYLFKSGFLLTRLALTDTAAPNGTITPTHNRAVVLIIDALRFDFISPDTPIPPSPYHHNILTLPAELTARHPSNSFLFNSYADPPTTTLQRIKGITTGSLPTFVDLGNNFGGSSIAEDSIIKQLTNAGKTVSGGARPSQHSSNHSNSVLLWEMTPGCQSFLTHSTQI